MRVLERAFALQRYGLLALFLGTLLASGRAVLTNVCEILFVGIELCRQESMVFVDIAHDILQALQIATGLGNQRFVVEKFLYT
jgi:hypothetical protein